MLRPIRRKNKEISEKASKRLLATERRGILALNGDNGYPYAIPVNYWYDESANKIYFHGSRAGYKADLLKKDSNICFTVYGNETIKDEEWAPYVQSVVIFGKCRVIPDKAKAVELVRKFAMKYYPNADMVEEEIASSGKAVQMFEIEIEHLSGKEIQER